MERGTQGDDPRHSTPIEVVLDGVDTRKPRSWPDKLERIVNSDLGGGGRAAIRGEGATVRHSARGPVGSTGLSYLRVCAKPNTDRLNPADSLT